MVNHNLKTAFVIGVCHKEHTTKVDCATSRIDPSVTVALVRQTKVGIGEEDFPTHDNGGDDL